MSDKNNKKSVKKICLTGGGTAGHVMPNVAIVPELLKRGVSIYYIGSKDLEKNIIEPLGIRFIKIQSGKLRRYFSLENFLDFFKVILGCIQSFFILLFNRVDLVFSKGGFVSVPVCVAAWVLRVPVITHEADLSMGLANRIISKLATKVAVSFEDTLKYLSSSKGVYTGLPIRKELLSGDREAGFRFCGFDRNDTTPIILIMGGSLGAKRINDIVYELKEELIKKFRIIHITGKNTRSNDIEGRYKSFEYISKELKDIFSISDFVIARSGANSVFEYLSLKIPMLLIPLEIGSRGDQVQNARYFEKKGVALVLRETSLNKKDFLSSISLLIEKKDEIIKNMEGFNEDSVAKVVDLIMNIK